MKTKMFNKISLITIAGLFLGAGAVFAQQPAIQYFRPYDQTGVNVFETSKADTVAYEGFKFRLGAGFTQQYQSLSHSNTENMVNGENKNKLYDLSAGFDLAQANFNMDAQLADGVRVSLVSYMSSRHHNEFWVKGGYLQIDRVGFLNSAFLNQMWANLSLKIGHMEINYGDTHFRRSDGGSTIFNPFIENNIMDAYTTEIGGELTWQKSGAIAMLGVTDGEIKGSTTQSKDRSPSVYGKIGYDNTFGDLRARLTGSFYTTQSSASNTLFGGDRTGSNYWMVLEPATGSTTGNAFSGRLNPGFKDNVTAFVVNPFVKFKGLELFGTYEIARGNSQVANGEIQSTNPANPALSPLKDREFTQYAAEAIYRFAGDRLYVGAKYNAVDGTLAFGESTSQPNVSQGTLGDVKVYRTSLAAGWFLTRNILMKGEYVDQHYKYFPISDIRSGGHFDGWVVEGVISF